MESPSERTVGSSLPITAIVALVAGVLLVLVGFLAYRSVAGTESELDIVIATGPETGTYHAVGDALGRLLEAAGVVRSAEAMPTDGSAANMRMIGAKENRADFALVQSDTAANKRARLVASLYDEHLHILVSRPLADEIQTIYDLRGRRVALGGPDSGTRQVAQRVLAHFDVEVGEDVESGPSEVSEPLANGTIDAAFILTAIPSSTVDALCERDIVRFLSLGNAQEVGNVGDALALVYPSLEASIIPHSTYGRLPARPVLSVSVTAQLIAARDLSENLVQTVTETLFQQRSHLVGPQGRLAVVERIRERYSPRTSTIPYHRGAAAYYSRQQPPFLVEYAETMSLGLAMLAAGYSGYIALREWVRRRRKNRIDAYYVEATRYFADVRAASREVLTERRDALVTLRQRAFQDLVNERLDANESFTILQDQIDSELRTIDALIPNDER